MRKNIKHLLCAIVIPSIFFSANAMQLQPKLGELKTKLGDLNNKLNGLKKSLRKLKRSLDSSKSKNKSMVLDNKKTCEEKASWLRENILKRNIGTPLDRVREICDMLIALPHEKLQDLKDKYVQWDSQSKATLDLLPLRLIQTIDYGNDLAAHETILQLFTQGKYKDSGLLKDCLESDIINLCEAKDIQNNKKGFAPSAPLVLQKIFEQASDKDIINDCLKAFTSLAKIPEYDGVAACACLSQADKKGAGAHRINGLKTALGNRCPSLSSGSSNPTISKIPADKKTYEQQALWLAQNVLEPKQGTILERVTQICDMLGDFTQKQRNEAHSSLQPIALINKVTPAPGELADKESILKLFSEGKYKGWGLLKDCLEDYMIPLCSAKFVMPGKKEFAPSAPLVLKEIFDQASSDKIKAECLEAFASFAALPEYNGPEASQCLYAVKNPKISISMESAVRKLQNELIKGRDARADIINSTGSSTGSSTLTAASFVYGPNFWKDKSDADVPAHQEAVWNVITKNGALKTFFEVQEHIYDLIKPANEAMAKDQTIFAIEAILLFKKKSLPSVEKGFSYLLIEGEGSNRLKQNKFFGGSELNEREEILSFVGKDSPYLNYGWEKNCLEPYLIGLCRPQFFQAGGKKEFPGSAPFILDKIFRGSSDDKIKIECLNTFTSLVPLMDEGGRRLAVDCAQAAGVNRGLPENQRTDLNRAAQAVYDAVSALGPDKDELKI